MVNEALQAGCSVVISDKVGCHANFGTLERVFVIPVGNAPALAEEIGLLSRFARYFDWAADIMDIVLHRSRRRGYWQRNRKNP